MFLSKQVEKALHLIGLMIQLRHEPRAQRAEETIGQRHFPEVIQADFSGHERIGEG